MNAFKGLLTIIVLLTLSIPITTAEDAEVGKALFSDNCSACHHLEMRLVGPPLKGVSDRREESWLLSFIRSSTSMIQSGDSTAVALFNTYNKVLMPDQDLTQDEIKSILAYIEASASAVSDAPFPRPDVVRSNATPLSFGDFRFWIIYTVTVVLVVVAVYYKAEMASIEQEVAESRTREGQ